MTEHTPRGDETPLDADEHTEDLGARAGQMAAAAAAHDDAPTPIDVEPAAPAGGADGVIATDPAPADDRATGIPADVHSADDRATGISLATDPAAPARRADGAAGAPAGSDSGSDSDEPAVSPRGVEVGTGLPGGRPGDLDEATSVTTFRPGHDAEHARAAVLEADGDAAPVPPRSGGMLVLGAPADASPPPEAPQAAGGPRCACGGVFVDGWCEQCGSPEPDPRAHLENPATDRIAGVTDVGIRHRINQDAMAIVVDGERAGIVVCDGVSSALCSEDASQAAADAAADVLGRATSTGVGVPASVIPALTARLGVAADAAADAVTDLTQALFGAEAGARRAPVDAVHPSCTFVAAAIEGDQVVVGSVGDSRAYWVPDTGQALRLTRDDSVAEERVALGVPRFEAETGPGAHTITRWIGVDSPDTTPHSTSLVVETPGWLVVCSDGLWNYASEPNTLSAVVADVAASAAATASAGAGLDTGPEGALAPVAPIDLARGLVTWANAQGGHDNITVVVARLTPKESPHG